MKIPVLIQQMQVTDQDVTVEDYLNIANEERYDIIRYPDKNNDDLISVEINIRPSDIIAYMIITDRASYKKGGTSIPDGVFKRYLTRDQLSGMCKI